MKKKIILLITLSMSFIMLGSSLSVYANTLSNESQLTISHIEESKLSSEERNTIVKGNPDFTVTNDIIELKLVYQKNATTGILPQTGLTMTPIFIAVGIATIGLGIILVKKPKHAKTLLIVGSATVMSLGIYSAGRVFAETTTLVDNVQVTKETGSHFTYEPEVIESYTYIGYMVSGTDNAIQEVDKGFATLEYRDQNGNMIAPTTKLEGKVGDSFNIDHIDIEGYVFKEVQGPQEEIFKEQAQVWVLVYDMNETIEQGFVRIHYQDEAGNEIAPLATLQGTIGSEYIIEKLNIEGYAFKEMKGTPSMKYEKNATDITLVYTKLKAGTGSVTVNYHDEKGQDIAPQQILTGDIGTPYQAATLDIEGFTFKELIAGKSANFEKDPQTITFIYKKNAPKFGAITFKFEDEAGNKIAEDTSITGPLGVAYTLDKKEIAGYTFKSLKGAISDLFIEDKQTITLTYSKNIDRNITVTIQYIDDETKETFKLPDLNTFNATHLDTSQYYLKFVNPRNQEVIQYKEGMDFSSDSFEIKESETLNLPETLDFKLYYRDASGLEQESIIPGNKVLNGYIGNLGGFSDVKGELKGPEIDETTGDRVYTYLVTKTPWIIDF